MIGYDDRPETVEITLTPEEGHHLLKFLDSPGTNGHDRPSFPTRQAVEHKLDDANALARWLREYVRLELDRTEAAELLDSLHPPLSGDNLLAEGARLALSAVRDHLSGCLPETSVGAR